MAVYTETTPSITSKGSKYSVYQTEGKQLSTEAIYRAKMKYGVYNNPSKVSLGVDPSASDTAALLATNTDLTITEYSRQLSADAATAALIAKGESPVAWKRDHIAPEAEYAAISARSPLKLPNSQNDAYDHTESNEAAAAALKVPSKSSLQEQYDFDDVRSGKVTLSQLNNGSKSLKSLSGSRDQRSGLVTSNMATEGSRKINISGISDAAKKSAAKTMTLRLQPELGSRSGIKTSSNAEAVNTSSSSIYIKDIYNQSKTASKKALAEQARTRSVGLQTPSDRGLTISSASFASGALKQILDVDYAATERSTLKDNSLVDKKVYAYAADRAKKTLSRLDDEAATKSIFANQKMNEKAYEIAYANAKKRKEANEFQRGNIQLGGGLAMPASEINKLAESLVQPALYDINDKIGKMKELDIEREKLPGQIKQREVEFQAEQQAKQLALENKRREEAGLRRDQLKLDEEELVNEHLDLKEKLKGELDEKDVLVNEHLEEYEATKTAIDEERAQKKQILDDAKAEKDSERENEINEMTAAHDEEIAPLLSEVDEENSKLVELVNIRKEKQEFVDLNEERVNKAQFELDELMRKLNALEEREAELTTEITEVDNSLELETGKLETSDNQMRTEGEQMEKEIPEMEEKFDNLNSERTVLHSTLLDKVGQVNELDLNHHTEAKAINEIYPDHLRPELEEHTSLNDDDLKDENFKLDEKSLEIPPEVESEPEVEPENIWPTGFNPESKEYIPKKEEVEEPEVEEDKLPKSEEVKDPLNDESEPKLAKVSTGASSKVKVPLVKSDKKTSKGFFGLFKRGKKAEPEHALKSKPKPASEAQKKFKGLQTEKVEKKPAGETGDNEDVFSGFSQGS